MDKLQDRGRFFVNPNEEVYGGQGRSARTRRRTIWW